MKRRKATAEQAIEYVAMKYHTTPEDVRKEIMLAIQTAMRNPDPTIQEKWKSIPRAGDAPTPEEAITYFSEKLTE